MNYKIPFWRTSFGEDEINHIADSIRNECVSQGTVTAKFEQNLSEHLQVNNVVAVSSGSSAILLALMTMGVHPGDEIIVPNRTWIATAHAVHLLGAKVVLVDVENRQPTIDVEKIEERITKNTKGIIPVHLNGRSADMKRIREIAKSESLFVIEDAAQALSSRNINGFLGTQSEIGCFSLSVAKTIATGQGGFAVTNNSELAKRMRAIRTHGVENVKDPERWVTPGFNFRLTDIQSSIGIEQLKRLPERIEHLRKIYKIYSDGLKGSSFKQIEVNLEAGEIPVYNEFLVKNRSEWIECMLQEGIESRPFYPDIDTADYFPKQKKDYPNSRKYAKEGIFLPSGPEQSIENIKYVIDRIKNHVI